MFSFKLFLGNAFERNKNSSRKNVLKKCNPPNCSWGNDFKTIKYFRTKIFDHNFFHPQFPRKWFCNNKKFSTKHFFIQTVSEERILKEKNFDRKKFSKIFIHLNCFRRNYLAAIKKFPRNFSTKNFHKNFFIQTVSEKIILQQKKIFDQIFFIQTVFE